MDGEYRPISTIHNSLIPCRWHRRKVAHVLNELNLTYETVFLQFDKGEHKAPEFTKYNPNGRIPALIDHHNNDFVLWYVYVFTRTQLA